MSKELKSSGRIVMAGAILLFILVLLPDASAVAGAPEDRDVEFRKHYDAEEAKRDEADEKKRHDAEGKTHREVAEKLRREVEASWQAGYEAGWRAKPRRLACYGPPASAVDIPRDRESVATLVVDRVAWANDNSFIYDLGPDTVKVVASGPEGRHFIARAVSGQCGHAARFLLHPDPAAPGRRTDRFTACPLPPRAPE